MTELPPGASPVDAITPGTRLREWEVVRFRARGSYGVVFEARRSSWLEEPARALKVFDPIVSRAARDALLSEFSTLTAIRHPHLLAGIDAFDLDDVPFAGCVVFVLELAEEDLSHRVAHAGGGAGAGLTAPQVAAIGAEVATGLAALHGMGRIHGDVKPENILLVRDGPAVTAGGAGADATDAAEVGPGDGRWVLGDFGVTSVLEGSYAFTPGTTIDYRPPELATAIQGTRLHRSADVWALGVSLYVAATGRHPFPGPDPMMRYAAVVRGERPAVPADLDPGLWSVIQSGCLDPDPRHRLDATTLATHLRAVAAGTPRPITPSPAATGPGPSDAPPSAPAGSPVAAGPAGSPTTDRAGFGPPVAPPSAPAGSPVAAGGPAGSPTTDRAGMASASSPGRRAAVGRPGMASPGIAGFAGGPGDRPSPSGGWGSTSEGVDGPAAPIVPWAVGSAVVALVVAQVVALLAGGLTDSLGARRGIYVGGSLALLALATVVAHARWSPSSRQLAGAAAAGLAAWSLVTVQLVVGVVGVVGFAGAG